MKTIWRLLKLVWPYKKWILLSVLLGTITVGSGIGLMMTSAFIISAAALHPSVADLQVAIVGVRFFGISRGVFRYLERLVSHETTFRLLTRFRVWFYRRLEPLVPARTLYMKSADLLQRIIADIQTLENFYVRVISPPAVAFAVGVLMFFLLGGYHLKYAVLFLIFFALSATVIPFLSLQLSRGLGKKIVALQSELHMAVLDDLHGLPELLVNNRLDNQAQKIERLNGQLNALQKKMHIIEALNQNFVTLLMFGAVVTTLLAAIPAVSHGELDGVYLAVLVMGIMAAFEAVLPLPAAAQFMEANVSAGQRLFGILQEKPAVVDVRQAQELPPVTFEIAFEKVTFTYPKGEQPALSDISFRVPPGAKIAVVGPSGAGKSSLAQLLLRLYEFEQGKILLDGQDIRRFKQESIRERVAFVSQRIHLFTGTIGENLRMVNPELSDEALIDLLRLVELHADDLQTDSPLDYWIGEHGNRLSGGQAQRLAIAQALCKPAMVFVFDEITANLDPQTEQRVLRNLFERYQGKTVINITHRLTGMERYDRILVFREGKLVEEGTHQTLMRQGTVYRHMMAVQQEQNLL